jgi:tetratricopeptide (TPR) repeat protein
MPEQLSNSNHTDARAHLSRRSTRAATFSVAAAAALTVAAWRAPVVAFAQSAPQPRTAPAQKVSGATDAKAKVTGARQEGERKEGGKKPAPASASEITRARRAAAPASAATPSAANASVDTPSAAPKPVPSAAPSTVPVVAPPVVAVPTASAPEGSAAAAKSMNEEVELERLRAEIKDAKPGAERARLQRSLVERLVALKRQPEALDALRLMIHEDRFDPPFFFNTGNALARLGDTSAAEDAYRKAILQRRGNYPRALNNLGVILIRQGHWDEAQETLNAALVQENYAYPEASYNLGRLHLLRGEADLAIREWLRTLRLEPAHAEAAAALARAYAEDGDPARGINVLDAFIARSARTGAGVPREIGEARRELAAATTAPAEDLKPANSNGSGDASGDGAGGERDVRPARPAGAKFPAHKIDPDAYELLRSARAARERGSVEEAVKHYRGVLGRSPGNYFPPANVELGTALMNLRRDEEAIAVLLPLTQKDAARYPVVFYHLGRLFERGGHPARAADNYRRAAELYGDANPQVLIDLSRLRERAGDHAGALDAMNDYAASMGRQGTVPAWVAERQAKLRQKAAASTASSAPNNSTPSRR